MSQEQLADQVARASEERQTIEQRLQQAEKVYSHSISTTCVTVYVTFASSVHNYHTHTHTNIPL